VIYQASSTDADGTLENRAVSYSLKAGEGDEALLEIDASTGAVRLKASANFENKASYSFTVIATNVGTGATLNTEQTVTVNVADLNEAPLIDTSVLVQMPDQAEDAVVPSPGQPLGTRVGDIAQAISDPDTSALKGLAITSVSTLGTLYYSLDNGESWEDAQSLSATRVLLLDTNSRVLFVPDTHYFGRVNQVFVYRAWDQTADTAGTYVDLTDRLGGSHPYSIGSGSVGVVVTPVNDAPTSQEVTLSPMSEDTASRLITSAELLALAQDIEGNQLTVSDVVIVQGGGSIANNGDGTWLYLPAANDDTLVRFRYRVTDNGSTDGVSDPKWVLGGAVLDLTPVPEAPTLALVSDTGDSTSDRITRDGTVQVNGLEPSSTWEFSRDAGQSWNAGVGATFVLPHGVYGVGDIQVRQTVDGATGPTTSWSALRVDTTAPVFTSASAMSVAENTSTSVVVYNATADADVGVSYSLSGTDATAFTVNVATGELHFRSVPNFEVKNSYSLAVVATDVAGNQTSHALAVSVTNTNDPAASGADINLSTLEDTVYTFLIGDFLQSYFPDEDAGGYMKGMVISWNQVAVHQGQWQYRITGSDWVAMPSDLSSNNLAQALYLTSSDQLRFVPTANWFGSPNALFFRPADNTFPDFSGGTRVNVSSYNSQTGSLAMGPSYLRVQVTSVNDAPVVANFIPDQVATEDVAFVYTVASNTFTDVDIGTTLTYGATQVDGSALPGWLQFNAGTRTFSGTPLNTHVGAITVRVTASDSALSVSDDVVFTVLNTNDVPAGAVSIDGVAEQFQTLSANTGGLSDDDGLGALSYQWLRDGVAIAGAIQQQYTLSAADVGSQLQVRVSYTDARGAAESVTSSPTATVLDTTAPAITAVSFNPGVPSGNGGVYVQSDVIEWTVSFDEAVSVSGQPRLAVQVGGVTAYAAYVSGSGSSQLMFRYTVVSGQSDANGVSVLANGVQLNGGSIVDTYGNAASLQHVGLGNSPAYTVDALAPVFTSGTTASVSENAAPSVVVYDATADSDSGVAYSLHGTDAGFFSINNVTGEVRLLASANFEVRNSYSLVVRATDTVGLSANQSVTVTVSDANDAPQVNTGTAVSMTTVQEDAAAPVNGVASGELVSALLGASTDADAGATLGMALTGVAVRGTLHVSFNNGQTWQTVTGLSDSQALLLAPTARLHYTPASNDNGTVSAVFTYRAWDQTEGSSGQQVNLSGELGGGNAYSAQTGQVGIVVTAVNDAPTVVDDGVTNLGATRNEPFSYAVPLTAFNDVDGDTLTLGVTGLPAGLSFNPSTRVISGIPTATGNFTVTVTANDGRALVSDTFVLAVVNTEVAVTNLNLSAFNTLVTSNNAAFNTGNRFLARDPSIGFGTSLFPGEADDQSIQVNIDGAFSGGLSLFGQVYTSMFVNTNGNITFGQGFTSFSGLGIAGWSQTFPIIAAFFDDIVIGRTTYGFSNEGGNSTGSRQLYFRQDATNKAVFVTWDDVSPYAVDAITTDGSSRSNAFQIKIIQTPVNGELIHTIEFVYENISWAGGISSADATAGWAAPNAGTTGVYGVTTWSGSDSAALNAESTSNVGLPGVWRWHIGTDGKISSGGSSPILDRSNTSAVNVANIVGKDANGGTNVSYTLADSADGRFTIVGTGNNITVRTVAGAVFANSESTVNIVLDVHDAAAGTNFQKTVQIVLVGNATVPPVVLDLDGDGDLSYTMVSMDVNSDGQLDHTAWAAQQDGVLVLDAGADRRVTHMSEYAFARHAGETDLQGLAAQYDSNADGVLDARDERFHAFAVWQDSNGNGVSDEGEVRSLSEWRITAIGLHSDGVVRSPAEGVHEAGRASAQLANGQLMVVGDVAFEYRPVVSPAAVRLDFTGLSDMPSQAEAAPSVRVAFDEVWQLSAVQELDFNGLLLSQVWLGDSPPGRSGANRKDFESVSARHDAQWSALEDERWRWATVL
jgi:hypothetical protein